MTRQARGAILLAIATAVGESILQAQVTTDWSNTESHALLFAFLVGPLLYLALLTWRRRTHAARSQLLFVITVLIAVGGLGMLGYNLYRFNTDEQFRTTPNMSGLIVPLVQWGVVMAVWIGLVVREGSEKRAAKQAAQATQPAQTASGANATNSP